MLVGVRCRRLRIVYVEVSLNPRYYKFQMHRAKQNQFHTWLPQLNIHARCTQPEEAKEEEESPKRIVTNSFQCTDAIIASKSFYVSARTSTSGRLPTYSETELN